ncbi:MAG: TldD/PmbA family protein [Moraxellaceae bacterium]|nr:TldD/PmbA family protein [Moraxellaceae bacterium]
MFPATSSDPHADPQAWLHQTAALFRSLAPAVDFCSLRIVDERSDYLGVRQDVLQPPSTSQSRGAMVSVVHRGGYGYAATSDLSAAGLREAIHRAMDWAARSAGHSVIDFTRIELPRPQGRYASPGVTAPVQRARREIIDLLMAESKACRTDARIVDWSASLWTSATDQLYATADGAEAFQQFRQVMPSLSVSANAGADTQTRSFAGGGLCRQGDLSVLLDSGFVGSGPRLAAEAIALLEAPNCPTGRMDLLLMPSQMMLQIHESIGHPLELDRILGDERNFAGTSFVTLDMFGHYQYGSPLLNISFDPTRAEELASYGWDDEGTPASKVFVIRDGVLQHPLGGSISQARAAMAGHAVGGAASARASSWNRPPLDRMSNLNVEPGDSTLDEMIASVERGVLMDGNISWSIDDSRNKFQFGCEYGRLIENGELKGVVRNPNYRGISASFWRSLRAVGNAGTLEVMGTPFCGKAEPSQIIRVGHASPACLFSDVEVFGAEA